jgi:hypothetical protein
LRIFGSGALEFGFSTLWLMNTLENGDTTCGFHDSYMLSANMGGYVLD